MPGKFKLPASRFIMKRLVLSASMNALAYVNVSRLVLSDKSALQMARQSESGLRIFCQQDLGRSS